MGQIEKITSRDNRRLVAARKVRDDRAGDSMFIEGKRLAVEAIRSNISISDCFVSDAFHDRELADTLASRSITMAELSEKLFRTIAATETSQGIVLIAKRPVGLSVDELPSVHKLPLPVVLFLNETNNPSNLGAVLRTAEAAGVHSVIISRHSADVYGSKALRAAMGATFRLSIVVDADFDEAVNWASQNKMKITAADISGSTPHTETDWTVSRLLIFGSEAHGLSETQLTRVDEKIVVPMEPDVESLNIAVSAGVVLFEARRQNASPIKKAGD